MVARRFPTSRSTGLLRKRGGSCRFEPGRGLTLDGNGLFYGVMGVHNVFLLRSGSGSDV